MNRAERARAAGALRAQGYLLKDIAATLGISYSYAQALCADPDGTRVAARKASYRGVCEQCGARTDGSNGPARAPKVCADCASQQQHEDRYWNRERILEGIHRFVKENGRKPLAPEWLYGSHGLRGDGYPYVSVVQREFGTWNAAMKAAGLPTEEPGRFKRSAETLKRMSDAQAARWGYDNMSAKAREFAAEFNGESVPREELFTELKKRGIKQNAWLRVAKAEGIELRWVRVRATEEKRAQSVFARLFSRAA